MTSFPLPPIRRPNPFPQKKFFPSPQRLLLLPPLCVRNDGIREGEDGVSSWIQSWGKRRGGTKKKKGERGMASRSYNRGKGGTCVPKTFFFPSPFPHPRFKLLQSVLSSCRGGCRPRKKRKKGPSHSPTNFLVPIDPSPVDIRGGRGGRSRRGGGGEQRLPPPEEV